MAISDSEDLIKDYAKRLRQAYCAARKAFSKSREGRESSYGSCSVTRWDGGKDSFGRERQAIWPKLAQFVIRHQIGPEEFVEAQFSDRVHHPPMPDQMMNAAALVRYSSYAGEHRHLAASVLEYEQRLYLNETERLAKAGQSLEQARRAVLRNRSLSLSSLFRYCLAKLESFDDLVDYFADEALRQYLSKARLYDLTWGAFIPADFKNEVQQLVKSSARDF